MALKHFMVKKEGERFAIEFVLENPTKDAKIFHLTKMLFKKDNAEYSVIYLEEKDGIIKGVDFKGGCRTLGKNTIVIEPYKNCNVRYGGKLWAKGVVIPRVEDLDGGLLILDKYQIPIKKTTIYELKAYNIYWK